MFTRVCVHTHASVYVYVRKEMCDCGTCNWSLLAKRSVHFVLHGRISHLRGWGRRLELPLIKERLLADKVITKRAWAHKRWKHRGVHITKYIQTEHGHTSVRLHHEHEILCWNRDVQRHVLAHEKKEWAWPLHKNIFTNIYTLKSEHGHYTKYLHKHLHVKEWARPLHKNIYTLTRRITALV